jgi:L-ascorbate metabolism protein UlaG (beta-lactamase superfamily)
LFCLVFACLENVSSGDTIGHKKVINALHGHKTDILIPNVGAPYQNAFGGPFTFKVKTLQSIVDTIKPDIIFPVHFGTFSHFRESSSTIKSWTDQRVKIFVEGNCFQN